MTYASGHPVRAVGGRLALDFVNTADWTGDDRVAHEKLVSLDDLSVWARALGFEAAEPPETISQARALRVAVRTALKTAAVGGRCADTSPPNIAWPPTWGTIGASALTDLVVISALSLLADPREIARVKLCPGDDCGWLFLDETKNARRRWCQMATCGNRAKAARHMSRRRGND